MSPTTPFSTLARALARGTRPADLLPELHRELLAATGATRSIVLETTGAAGTYILSSGRGFTALDLPWIAGPEAQALADITAPGPQIASLATVPSLARHFGEMALVIPLRLAKRPTVLLVSTPHVPEETAVEAAARAAVEFGIVLEWSRLAREGTFHRRMRELSLVFSRGVRSVAGLGSGLELVAHEANTLLGTRRITVWLHDRRARNLTLVACSDPAQETGARVNADDSDAPAARGLRLERPEVSGVAADRMVIAPLRGWRRAQGTMILEGGPAGMDDDQLVELSHELGRQLAAGIENAQLLDEILRQRRLLEDSFNSLADLVIVTDASHCVVQVNDACVDRLSVTREQILGRELAEIAGPAVATWAAADSGSAGQSHTFDNMPVPGIFAATITPLINEDDETVGQVLVARDITEQTRLESEREALRERLAQSEKLAALGQFVAGIAHEMNNPLQGIMGHLELLIDHSADARPVRAELRRIFREADRASRIVRNLLVFTGARRMTRRRLRIDRVIARAVASRRAALERAGITVVSRFPESLPPVTGDPLLLQQAFLNILINAEHAIDAADGLRTIETSASVNGNNEVVAIVRDTGTGIPADVLPRIFDPFFSTKEVGKGTGLGLAITYGIVQEHDGTIQASNAPDGGAVFTIALPVSAEVR